MDALRERRRASGGGRLNCKLENTPTFGIAIYERVTAATRTLMNKARDLARERNWKYVWIKEGKVVARKSDHDRVLFINSSMIWIR